MIALPPGTRLVLASASPRRAELLRSVGLDFVVRPSDLDEMIHDGESPADYVRRLSLEKAAAALARVRAGGMNAAIGAAPRSTDVVIAADTTVEVDRIALAKPVDAADARRMLRALSGRSHHVHTGVTVTTMAGPSHTQVVTTEVEFVTLDDAAITWYVGTGEPFGKAGAYAIQGAGGALVARVDGSVTNVIGLPLAETLGLLRTTLAGTS